MYMRVCRYFGRLCQWSRSRSSVFSLFQLFADCTSFDTHTHSDSNWNSAGITCHQLSFSRQWPVSCAAVHVYIIKTGWWVRGSFPQVGHIFPPPLLPALYTYHATKWKLYRPLMACMDTYKHYTLLVDLCSLEHQIITIMASSVDYIINCMLNRHHATPCEISLELYAINFLSQLGTIKIWFNIINVLSQLSFQMHTVHMYYLLGKGSWVLVLTVIFTRVFITIPDHRWLSLSKWKDNVMLVV